jgi:hypothetical protein
LGKFLPDFRTLGWSAGTPVPRSHMTTFFLLGMISVFALSGLLLALAAILMSRASGVGKPPPNR